MQKGLVEIYTGDGKGKTTAAFGLVLRALGRDKKVIIFQFLKPPVPLSGEVIALKKAYPDLEIIQGGRNRFVIGNPEKEDILLAKELLNKIILAVSSGRYDIIVIDEVFPAYRSGVISIDDIKEIIDKKTPNTELILTGRGAPEEILQEADLITEMRKIRHPYDKGVKAREGIEF
ncbi:MAG: cob(I)yrinic acid a,c-diamide adenosyltransferase [bacterium]